MILTEAIAITALRDFFHECPFVFIGSGMSCALDDRFGMPALTKALVASVPRRTLTAQGKSEWSAVETALSNRSDLESAMDAVKDDGLLSVVTDVTAELVATTDRECGFRIADGEAEWPATRLIQKMVDCLPEGDPVLHVLTPNYDLLLEYACDAAGIPFANGFLRGVSRESDWDAIERAMRVPKKGKGPGQTLKTVWLAKKHIRLYKVHGSLDYFEHQGSVVENASWTWDPPKSARRVMITPGSSKYEAMQLHRRELQQTADGAIDKSSRFLFLGYGFNDTHLHNYIRRKLVEEGCPGVILTRDSNDQIESLLLDAKNLWLVCKCDVSGQAGTRIFNSKYEGSLEIPGVGLWDVATFTAEVLGG